ncbi:MAG: acylphosphatase [Candidatus Latescibacteria bacterium]|jgi:acylphosphatase|nr:acylphosphatase [Candidatus Latescibacterota bacterium]MBT5832627.1 acylphosphatase [Candidatus Latescibacterota bacterium]
MDDQIRKCVKVVGRVQGVGFRYFAHKQAKKYGLVGYVRNLPNGEVEVDVAGNTKDVDDFLCILQKGPSSSRVDLVTEQVLPLQNLPDTFDIRYF